jgi:hypothetical protein
LQYDDTESEAIAVDRICTGAEQRQSERIEYDDDQCRRADTSYQEPDEHMEQERRGGGDGSQESNAEGKREQYCGQLYPGGYFASIDLAIEQQREHRGHAQQQQCQSGQAAGKHGEEPLHQVRVRPLRIATYPTGVYRQVPLLGDLGAAATG